MARRPWEIVVPKLTASFASIGETWYNACVDALPPEIVPGLPFHTYGETAREAVSVMQYQALIQLLENPRVLRRDEMAYVPQFFVVNHFRDQNTAARRMQNYLSKPVEARLFSFGGDVAREITLDPHPVEAAAFCAAMTAELLRQTQMSTLSIFLHHNIRPLTLWERLLH